MTNEITAIATLRTIWVAVKAARPLVEWHVKGITSEEGGKLVLQHLCAEFNSTARQCYATSKNAPTAEVRAQQGEQARQWYKAAAMTGYKM